jgi:large subunit ribosomal protein L9
VQVGEEEKMFGAVTANDIHKKLDEKGISVERHQIDLEDSIKALGIYHVPVRVSSDMKPELKVYVIKA